MEMDVGQYPWSDNRHCFMIIPIIFTQLRISMEIYKSELKYMNQDKSIPSDNIYCAGVMVVHVLEV